MGDNAIDVPPLQLLGEHVPPSTPWIAAHAPDREGVVLNQCVLNPDPPILPQWYAGNQKGLTFLNIYRLVNPNRSINLSINHIVQ